MYNQRRYVPTPEELVLLIENLEISPITLTQIKNWTDHDPVLATVRKIVQQEWPRSVNPEFHPFHTRQLELTTQEQCLLWGSRIIILKLGRETILELLHEDHPGISKMKTLARSYVWWPNIDSDIEAKVKQCNQCQINRPFSPVVPVHPRDWPEHPWQCIHLGYAGPFLEKMFLIVIDANFKWMEVKMVDSATVQATIEHLKAIFAMFWLT